jgi:hypothetical protein
MILRYPEPVRPLRSCFFKLKAKSSLCLINWAPRHEDVWKNSGIALLLFTTRWRLAVSFTSRPLYVWKNKPQYLFDTRLGKSQSRAGRSGEIEILCTYRESDPDHLVHCSTDWTIPAASCFFKIRFNISLPTTSISRYWPLTFRFTDCNADGRYISHLHMSATSPNSDFLWRVRIVEVLVS